MKSTSLLQFFKGEGSGSAGKVSGSPLVLPEDYPWNAEDDKRMAFLLELYLDSTLTAVGADYALQLYQTTDESDDPQPIPVLVALTGERSLSGRKIVPAHPSVGQFRVDPQNYEEPDELPPPSPTSDYGRFMKSKIGGNDPWAEFSKGLRFLGQIVESPCGFNFGGTTCSIYLDDERNVRVLLNSDA